MTVHCTFRADRSSGSQLHEMQLFGIEWPTLANSLSQRFNRCDVLRMLPRQAEVEPGFVAHTHTHCSGKSLLPERIAQTDRAIEHEFARLRLDAVGAEVTLALELVASVGRRIRQRLFRFAASKNRQ